MLHTTGDLVTSEFDIAVLGAGISGLTFAHQAARAGLECAVFDRAAEPGGCLHTVRTPEGFWFELGAHTLYNSYGALLAIVDGLGLKERIQNRHKAPYRLWVDGKIRSVPSQLSMGELFASAWRAFTEEKAGHTVEEYYGRLVGKGNWKRVFGPLLAAVPSQRADAFPAEMLFKRRPRRKDFPRTFTFEGGLSALVDRMSQGEHLTLRTNVEVQGLTREGACFAIHTADGAKTLVRKVVLALPPPVAARLVAELAPDVARALSGINFAEVTSTGVVVDKQGLSIPAARRTGSARRCVLLRGHPRRGRRRALPGLHLPLPRGHQSRCASGTDRGRDGLSAQQLPSCGRALGLPALARPADTARSSRPWTPPLPAAVSTSPANFFAGLAIEDCALRSRAECDRLLRDLQKA